MQRIGFAFLAVTLAGAFACQSDNKSIERKLDDIEKRVAELDAKLSNLPAAGAPGAAARPPQQARAKPDPSHVHAVPIGESAVIGPRAAKVTIIEAFTFT